MQTLKLFTICCALSALTLGAEVIEMSKKAEWLTPNCAPVFKDGKIISMTLAYLKSKRHFVIDEKKSYTVTFDVKRAKADPDTKKPNLYVGYEGLDAKGNPVPVYTYQTLPDSFTEITAAAKKGDMELRVKNGTKWRVSSISHVMINAKEDFSDLPNRNCVAVGIKKVEKVNNEYVVTLRAPLKADVAAGTKARVHSAGGYFYIHPSIHISDDKVQNIKAVTKGFNNYGWMSRHKFPRGVPKWRLIFLVNDRRAKSGLEISNIKMTIE